MGTQPGNIGDEKFSNWVKDTLALLYTKECMEVIADERSAVFHGQLKIAVGNNLTCTCSWQDLETDRRKHKWVVKNCPGVCQKWLDLIISHHSNHPLPKLAPRNTDPSRWPSDTWEVMKVYQSNGCQGHHSAQDADVAALIDLMRNCDHFVPLITNPSLVNQVITIRNNLMHSKDFKVENQELSHDLQSMLSFLNSLTTVTGAPSLSVTEQQAVQTATIQVNKVTRAPSLSVTELQAIQTAITQVNKLCTSILDLTLNRELQLKALKAKQVALETDMKVLEQTIIYARTDTAAVKSGLTGVEDKLTTEVQTLQQRLVSQLSLIQDVKKDMTSQQSMIQDVKKDMQSTTTVVSNLARLQQQFDDLRLDHDETKKNIKALNERMSDLEVTGQQQTSTITTLYQRQQTTERELQHQQQESQAHASQLDNHQNELDTHTTKLGQLEAHQGELDTHTIMLQDHGTQLQGHQSHIESQHRTLGSHETQLQGHESHIESQNRTLDSHDTQLQGHQSHIMSQNRTLDSHDTQLQGHQSHIESQNRTLNSHETQLQGHQSHIESQNRTLDSHETQLQGHQSHIESQNRTLDSKDTQLQGHQSHIESQNRTLECHGTQLQGHQSHIESQNRTLDSHDTQLQGHQSHIESQNRTLDSHDTQLQGHQSHIESQNRTLDSHDTQLQGHQSHIESQNRTLDSHDTQLQGHQSHIESQNRTLDSHDTQLQGHQSHIESQNRTLDSHETQLQGHQSHIESQNRTLDSHDTQLQGHQSHIESQNRTLECHGAVLDRLENKQIAQQTDQAVDIKGIQRQLVSMYKAWIQHFPVYLLRSERKIRLEDFYVEQCLKVVDADGRMKTNSSIFNSIQKNPVAYKMEQLKSSLRDVFYSKGNTCKFVYVSGNAGYGKSIFCSHLVRLWCKAHSENTTELTTDEKLMAEFPLLFCVDLRDAKYDGTVQTPDEMCSLIQKQLQKSGIRLSYDYLSKLLQADGKVLVVMDALDECKEERLPRGGICHNCTTLITSRPWKFEALRCDPECRVDKEIEIVGLKRGSSEDLSEKLVNLLNKKWSKSKDSKDFIRTMKEEGLQEFLDIPMMLTSMLCLWFDDIPFGQSQFEVYRNSIHHQILTAVKAKDIPGYSCPSEAPFPVCQREDCRCTYFGELLWNVSQFAYKALLGNVRERSLVMDHDQTEFLGLTDEEVVICMKLGILTQYKLLGNVTDYEPQKSVSFTHKTYQEWFAAIYVSSKLPMSELDKLLSEAIDDLDSALELDQMFLFVCGLSEEVSAKLYAFIMSKVSSDTAVQEYRMANNIYSDQLIRTIQDVAVAGNVEAKKNNKMSKALQLQDVHIKGHSGRFSTEQILACDTSQVRSVYINDVCIRGRDVEKMKITPWPASLCLKRLVLWDITNALDDTFCDNFSAAHLDCLLLNFVTLTHDQLEGLCTSLASAGSLRTVKIYKLTCSTHQDHRQIYSDVLGLFQLGLNELRLLDQDNKQDCSIVLDLSRHQGLEELTLKHLCVGEVQGISLCQNMDKLDEVELYKVTLSHDQLERLCVSLASARSLRRVDIEMLTCVTHKDNIQACYIQLEFSQYERLKSLSLETEHQSGWQLPNVQLTSWPSSSYTETVDLCNLDISLCDTFCDKFVIDMVSKMYLKNVILAHDQLESLCGGLASAGNLRTVYIRELTCITHQDNRQECGIRLNLSQDQGLKELRLLDLGVGEVQGVSLCQNMEKVELRNITLTHGGLESLCGSLATAASLMTVEIRELTCKTHQDNRQDCCIQLDFSQYIGTKSISFEKIHQSGWQLQNVRITSWPSSSCMETLDLRRVDLSPCDTFCDNFIIDMVSNMYLENVRLPHKQLESLCESMASEGSLRTVHIRELTCITHQDNRHDCSIRLNLSQHRGLKELRLLDLGVGEVQEVSLCQNIETVELCNITLTHGGLESLCGSLATAGSLMTVEIRELTCKTHKDNIQACYIQLDFSKYIGTKSISFEKIHQSRWQLPNVKITSWPSSSSCIKTVDLRSVDMLPCDTFCDNFVIDMVSNMYLEKIKLTHDQLESLCGSLTSAGNLRTVDIRELTCITHQDNRHDCSIRLNLSQHRGLKELRLLDLGVGEVQGVSLCQNMEKLEKMELCNITLTHGGLESLCGSLATAASLRREDIRELTCITHKDNRQDCCIQLDFSQYIGTKSISFEKIHQSGWQLPNVKITSWPSSTCIMTVDLRSVDMLPCDTFCDNFVIDMVSNMYLENVKLTHDQLESLCGSLASARSLRTVVIRELTCITHQDNRHDCSIMLDLSRHQGLKELRLLDLGVGEVQGVSLCQNMEKVELSNITLTHGRLESLCGSLTSAGSPGTVEIRELTCKTHKDNIQECYIQLDFSQYIGTKSISFEKIHQSGWQLQNVKITSWPSSTCVKTVDLRSVDMLPCDTFCDNFVIDMVSSMYLENVKLTHDQLESLCGSLTSAGNLRTVDIRGLTCTTHQDNRHDCSIRLNLSQHRALKRLTLANPCVCEVREVSLCQSMDKLENVQLCNTILTHDVLESLCESLASARSLGTVVIRELTCITHQGNRQECGIMLDFSQQQGLEKLTLDDPGVGEVLGVGLCQNRDTLRLVKLGGFCISAAALRQTLEALPRARMMSGVGLLLVDLGGHGKQPLRVRGVEEARQLLVDIQVAHTRVIVDDVEYTGDECVVHYFRLIKSLWFCR